MVSKKGIHIIRALFPEDFSRVDCWWCGKDARFNQGTPYRPMFKWDREGSGHTALCWECGLKCSELAGQPMMHLVLDLTPPIPEARRKERWR